MQYISVEDREGTWLSGCCGSVAEHWQLKPEVSWVRLPARAAERAEQRGPGEKLTRAKRAKMFQLINYSYRRGQLINGVGSACLHASK